MEFQATHAPIPAEGVICPGCGESLHRRSLAFQLTGLPSILRSTMGEARYHGIECLRIDARRRYRAQLEFKSNNRFGWQVHAATNDERLLTLKLLSEWAEARRTAETKLPAQ
ncbi:MAG: hypothetical protein WAN87_07165 [Thermoplasmata archaeon]